MWSFLRIGLHLGLWLLYFYKENSWSNPYTLLLCAIVISLYYFLPVAKKPLLLYFVMHLSIIVLFMFITQNQHALLLFIVWVFSLEAIKDLKEREFKLYAVFSIILHGIALFWMDEISWLGFVIVFYVLATMSNTAVSERGQLQEMYEVLAGEYRQVKRLASLAEEEARNEERTKIARDIHDSVGHKLTALLMQLEVAVLEYGADKIAPLKELAKDNLEETRRAVKALRSEEIEGISTIIQLIKRLESESHLVVHFTTKKGILSTKLTNEEGVVLYRVIQEGLTNAMRHGHVREVYVELGRSAIGHIEFMIKNRIPQKTPFAEGFGIQNLRERVEKLGGELLAYQTETHFYLKGHFPPKMG